MKHAAFGVVISAWLGLSVCGWVPAASRCGLQRRMRAVRPSSKGGFLPTSRDPPADAPRGAARAGAAAGIRSAVNFARVGSVGPRAVRPAARVHWRRAPLRACPRPRRPRRAAQAAARARELQRCRAFSEVELRAILVGRGVSGAGSPEVPVDLLAELLAELRLAQAPQSEASRPERPPAARRSAASPGRASATWAAPAAWAASPLAAEGEVALREVSRQASSLANFFFAEAKTVYAVATESLADALDVDPAPATLFKAARGRLNKLERKAVFNAAWARTRRQAKSARAFSTKIGGLGAKRGAQALLDVAGAAALAVAKWAGDGVVRPDHLGFGVRKPRQRI
ncbi:hypothetical protein M885DRAFT_346024 [Pelagophyceae sp. CCMP2097]|nr:hypothetical protein M885DRAFT_346024 [Pelagophyceae sp. CCMP2097]